LNEREPVGTLMSMVAQRSYLENIGEDFPWRSWLNSVQVWTLWLFAVSHRLNIHRESQHATTIDIAIGMSVDAQIERKCFAPLSKVLLRPSSESKRSPPVIGVAGRSSPIGGKQSDDLGHQPRK
jgi:hypothetical protein